MRSASKVQGRENPLRKCALCEQSTHAGATCRWCREVGAPSPLAELARERGALRRVAIDLEINVAVLRRAAVGDGVLSVDQAVAVAREIGVRPEDLSIEHAAARARARRAAARARAGGAA